MISWQVLCAFCVEVGWQIKCKIKCQGLQPASPLVGLAIWVLATCQEKLFLLEHLCSRCWSLYIIYIFFNWCWQPASVFFGATWLADRCFLFATRFFTMFLFSTRRNVRMSDFACGSTWQVQCYVHFLWRMPDKTDKEELVNG